MHFADVEVGLVVVVLVVAMHVADVEVVLYILSVQPLWLDMFSLLIPLIVSFEDIWELPGHTVTHRWIT